MSDRHGFTPALWKMFRNTWKSTSERGLNWGRWMRIVRHPDFDDALHGWKMMQKEYRGKRDMSDILDEMESDLSISYDASYDAGAN